jgi:phage gpG-like protein
MPENNLNDFLKSLQGKQNAIKKLLNGDLQRIVKREGLNHFEESWDNQGFTDKKLIKWDTRKPPDAKFRSGNVKTHGRASKHTSGRASKPKLLKSYKKWQAKNKGRAILVSHRTDTKGGHLKDSLTAKIVGTAVIFSTDKPYAKVHNEGGKAGRGAGFTMPKRQFLGESDVLINNIKNKITREINNTLGK